MLALGMIIISTQSALACSNFKVSDGTTVLYGNNEDEGLTITEVYITVIPGTDDSYGSIHVGYDHVVASTIQGGMNEMGLAYDGSAVPFVELNPHDEREPYSNLMGIVFMEKCATVDDVIQLMSTHSVYTPLGNGQWFFADKNGDSLTVSPSKSGEWVYTKNNANIDVISNYNIIEPSMGDLGAGKERIQIAQNKLETILTQDNLSVDRVSTVLESIHQEGGDINTIYSNIFDLTNGIVYLYYFHQFEEVITLNLEEELAKGFYQQRIPDLFSQEVRDRAFSESNSYKRVFGPDFLIFFATIILDLILLVKLSKLVILMSKSYLGR